VRWTAVEFLFTPLASGMITLDPFEVTAGGKKAATGNISVRIYEESRSAPRNAPVFRWESPPSSLTTGESRELTLVLSNWSLEALPGNFFRTRVPVNAVMEELPFEGPREDGTIRYRFRVIPLGGSSLVLEPFSFQAEGITLNVPRLSAALTPAGNTGPGEAAEPVREEEAPRESPEPEGSRAVPFPAVQGEGAFFRKEYERIIKEAGNLWNAGNYAQALAYMRRNERDSLPGPALAPLRRDMERSLGLSLTEDEKWQPWKIPAFSRILLLLLLAVAIGAWKIKVTSVKFKGYKNVVILVAAGSVLILLLLCGGLWNSKSGTPAVLEKTAAYRVPDPEGAVNALFSKGQPVVIRAGRSQWIYAEAMDGRAGWVPAEAVISY
jgi:hypothetical protein